MPDCPVIEGVLNPEAIVAWCDFESYKKAYPDVIPSKMTLKAKQHLIASNWHIWYGIKGTRRELRYTSPNGKIFYSLKTACVACAEEERKAGHPVGDLAVSLLQKSPESSTSVRSRSSSMNLLDNQKVDDDAFLNKKPNDEICFVCHEGGELLLCDGCPSSFHQSCLGIQGTELPEGDWFCHACRCGICDNRCATKDETTFYYCDQCLLKYHVDCTNNKGIQNNQYWFCNEKCEQLFLNLYNCVGKCLRIGFNNFTWSFLRSTEATTPDDNRATTTNQSKLNEILDLMHECFEPVKDPYTGQDIIEDVVFGKTSELHPVRYKGFYIAALQKNNQIITAATVRVYKDVAEIPFVGTRFRYRGHGMCRVLMNVLEKQLTELGVERLILPAAPSVEQTWIKSFGYSKMTSTERLDYLKYNLIDFQGTSLCHKLLSKNPTIVK